MRPFVERPTDRDYAEACRAALTEGKHALALEQISAALAFNPLSPPHLALLEQVLSEIARPLALLPGTGERFFGGMAVRAHVLAREGNIGLAIATIVEVAAFRPTIPYLAWGRRWIDGRGSLRGVQTAQLVHGLGRFAAALDAEVSSTAGARLNGEHALWLLERLGTERAQARDQSTLLAAKILRRIGDLDRAETSAGQVLDSELGPEAHLEIAAIAAERGDLVSAASSLVRGSERWPTHRVLALEAVYALLEVEEFERAARLGNPFADVALQSPLEHREGAIAMAYARSFLDPRGSARSDLAALGRGDGVSPRAMGLVERREDYLTRLPSVDDRDAAFVRGILARTIRQAHGGKVLVRVDEGERPPLSAVLALQAGLADLGVEGGFDLPEAPRSVPGSAALAVVVERASEPVDVDRWCGDATSAISLADADALLASPPAPRCGLDPVDRVQRVYVGALAALASGVSELGSEEARWLIDLTRHGDRWLASAAIVVVAALGRRIPDATRSVAGLLEVLWGGLDRVDARRRPLRTLRHLCTSCP